MNAKQVREQTGLTRKALAYYQQKQLIKPLVQENGYRSYSPEQVARLKEIAFLRDLDVPMAQIEPLLAGASRAGALSALLRQQEHDHQLRQQRAALLNRYGSEGFSPALQQDAAALARQDSFARRLNRLLPGGMGLIITLHFAPYLQSPAQTPAQEEAFARLLEVLDHMPSADLPPQLQQAAAQMDDVPLDVRAQISRQKDEALAGDIGQWLHDNAGMLREYSTYKQSAAYLDSDQYRLSEWLKQYFTTSSFYQKAIPLLRQLSPAYDAYYNRLLDANAKLLEAMPEIHCWPGGGEPPANP